MTLSPTLLIHLQAYLHHHQLDMKLPHFLLYYPKFISEFQFKANETLLSNVYSVAAIVGLYLLLTFTIKRWIDNSKPFDLKPLVAGYNYVLSLASALLFTLLTAEILNLIIQTSFLQAFCDPEPSFLSLKGPVVFFYYCNYIFKYVELIDTMFIVLRGKKLAFLHYYHHAATLILCYTQLLAQSCMQWVVIGINLFVHILLYYYYYAYEMNYTIWWKKHLTTLQIVQFCIALTACSVAMAMRYYSAYTGHGYFCHGTWAGSYFGVGILLSYLVLFMKLYADLYYQKKQQKANNKVAAAANGHGKKHN
jgi:fatty acid elongase 3